MPPERFSIQPDDDRSPELRRVAEAMRDGAIVVFPTETVYGIAANAASDDSIRRLQSIKHRDAGKPFTVHVGDRASVAAYAPSVSPLGRRLIRKAMPGPVTLIFDAQAPESAAGYDRLSATGASSIYGLGSVGIRFPAHLVASGLAMMADVPIVASSANAAGDAPPTEVGQIDAGLQDVVDFVIDAGPTQYRKASTVVALNGDGYRIAREGVLDERTIQRLARLGILFVCTGNTCRSPIAEGLCRKMLADRLGCTTDALTERGIVVQSAGVGGWPGSAASPESVEACRRRGADISGHRSQALGQDVLLGSDYIFTMTRGHLETIRAMTLLPDDRLMLLDESGDIADPIGGTASQYEDAAQQIERALAKRLENLDV
jgi:protein-tyrosine phosphatase